MSKIIVNTKHRLKETMEKSNDTREALSEYLNITPQTLSRKMNGHVDFTRKELGLIKIRYCLSAEDLCRIFFDLGE